MKKKLICVLVAAMFVLSSMTGCGSTVNVGLNGVNLEEYIDKAVQVAGDMKEAMTSSDEAAGISDKSRDTASASTDDLVPEDAKEDYPFSTDYSVETITFIEEQIKPVEIAVNEKWTESLHVGEDWIEKIREVNEAASAQAEIKLVDIDLDKEVVTYRITAPDVLGYLHSKIDTDNVFENLAEDIEEDGFPTVVNYVSLPVTVTGSDISVKVMAEKLMDPITGGFYSVMEILDEIVTDTQESWGEYQYASR